MKIKLLKRSKRSRRSRGSKVKEPEEDQEDLEVLSDLEVRGTLEDPPWGQDGRQEWRQGVELVELSLVYSSHSLTRSTTNYPYTGIHLQEH